MAKTRLNATERRVIIRKIREQILDKYEAKKNEIIDSYIPSEMYKEAQNVISLIKNTFSKPEYDGFNYYFGPELGNVQNEDFGKNLLQDIINREVTFPEYPCIKEWEIDDELVLKGLDKDWSVEKLIKKYVDEFKIN